LTTPSPAPTAAQHDRSQAMSPPAASKGSSVSPPAVTSTQAAEQTMTPDASGGKQRPTGTPVPTSIRDAIAADPDLDAILKRLAAKFGMSDAPSLAAVLGGVGQTEHAQAAIASSSTADASLDGRRGSTDQQAQGRSPGNGINAVATFPGSSAQPGHKLLIPPGTEVDAAAGTQQVPCVPEAISHQQGLDHPCGSHPRVEQLAGKEAATPSMAADSQQDLGHHHSPAGAQGPGDTPSPTSPYRWEVSVSTL
jgi:hypothetical protein